MFPFMRKADVGYRWALGIVMVLLNAVPFLMGVFRAVLSHFPMLNTVALVFCVLGVLFEIFAEYMDKFLWIESTAAVCSIASCVFWGLHKKYARHAESIKAAKKSGMFVTSEEGNNAQS